MERGQPDRVNYSFGMKIPLGDYKMADFHVNFSSDVKDGETWEQALQRVQVFVERECLKKLKTLKPKIDE